MIRISVMITNREIECEGKLEGSGKMKDRCPRPSKLQVEKVWTQLASPLTKFLTPILFPPLKKYCYLPVQSVRVFICQFRVVVFSFGRWQLYGQG